MFPAREPSAPPLPPDIAEMIASHEQAQLLQAEQHLTEERVMRVTQRAAGLRTLRVRERQQEVQGIYTPQRMHQQQQAQNACNQKTMKPARSD